jgi:hypothetical protein
LGFGGEEKGRKDYVWELSFGGRLKLFSGKIGNIFFE